MNYSTAVMLVNPDIRAVVGKYEEHGKETVFKTVINDLKVDDMVVVESGTRWNFTTVKIVKLDVDVDFDSRDEMKWVVQKIDIPAHEHLKTMENDAITVIKRGELRKRREDIRKNTLDAAAAGELDDLAIAKVKVTPVLENKNNISASTAE